MKNQHVEIVQTFRANLEYNSALVREEVEDAVKHSLANIDYGFKQLKIGKMDGKAKC